MLQKIRSDGAKNVLIALAGIIYVVGVIYADVMFLSIVQSMFPSGFLRTFAVVGAFLAGATAILLPIAVHWWFSPGAQKIVGMIFYAVDMAIMVLNVILAFQINQGTLDSNLAIWKAACPAVPVFCIIGWGIIYMLDNSHKIRDAQIALQHAQILRVSQGMEAGMNSPEVQDYLNNVGIAATKQMATQLSSHIAPGHQGNNNSMTSQNGNSQGGNQPVPLALPPTKKP